MTTRRALLICLVLWLAEAVFFAVVFSRLPDKVPTHWDINGKVDGWMSPVAAITFNLVLTALMAALTAAGQWLSPKGYEPARFLSVWNFIMVTVTAFCAAIGVLTVVAALNPAFEAGRLIVVAVLMLIALIGNVMGQTRQNYWAGIRTPWTLQSKRVWNETHRIAARWMVGAGVLGTILILCNAPMWTALVLIFVSTLGPAAYSFVLYQRYERG